MSGKPDLDSDFRESEGREVGMKAFAKNDQRTSNSRHDDQTSRIMVDLAMNRRN
jgi:hypothetical protein